MPVIANTRLNATHLDYQPMIIYSSSSSFPPSPKAFITRKTKEFNIQLSPFLLAVDPLDLLELNPESEGSSSASTIPQHLENVVNLPRSWLLFSSLFALRSTCHHSIDR